jgi:hypothetical protein
MVFKRLFNYTPEIRVMKKSELLKIIREEVEVVLTNAEAVEVFDLDPAALLDEIMKEANWADEPEADRPWNYKPSSAGGYSPKVDRERPSSSKKRRRSGDLTRPRPGESDEEFWQRQADTINRRLGISEEKDENWIQDAEKDIERRGTEGVCTGEKFGSDSCPPGSKRYNLAKTFRKMAKDRKKD